MIYSTKRWFPARNRAYMVRIVWALCVAMSGILLTSVVCGCIIYAIPDRGAARGWAIGVLLFLMPYALGSIGCWLSRSLIVRVLSLLIVLAGVLITISVVVDSWPTFSGGPPPGMPGSVFV